MKKNLWVNVREKSLFVWRIPSFPALFLINFIFGLSSSFFAPFSSIFGIDEAGMSNIGFGVFMTIMAIGGVTISSYIAKRSDTRTSRKKLMIIAAAAGVIGYTLFAFLRNYLALSLTGFFVLGTAGAAVPQLWAYARDALKQANIPAEQTPFIMNIFRMFFALSWTVGPALGSALLISVGFKGLFLSVAAGNLMALLTIVFLLKDVPRGQVSMKKAPAVGKYVKKVHIFAFLAAAFLLSTATSIHMLNMPQFVTKVLHGTEMDVGIIFSVPPMFEVPMMIIVGILATKMDNAKLILIGFATACSYFLLLNFVTEPWQIYPLQVLSAAQVSITGGIAISYFQDFIPEAQGTATTLYMNTTSIGSTLGYLLFGFISQVTNYGSLIIMYTVLAAVGLLFLVFLGKEKVKNSKASKTKVQNF
ncbi:sugar efflux transporter [Neobacillus cucumis]|uniref:sugar efflux transporter n=1 Tax=Neobacillus cucumis TaxID=1740721 RepID=UPI00196273F8|nr:sugar efflux transporter [Neobacillus cucumis]MBM7655671.1 SET family sugar efflux transporter-like MFS transporter [Neobacillus cucumis]